MCLNHPVLNVVVLNVGDGSSVNNFTRLSTRPVTRSRWENSVNALLPISRVTSIKNHHFNVCTITIHRGLSVGFDHKLCYA